MGLSLLTVCLPDEEGLRDGQMGEGALGPEPDASGELGAEQQPVWERCIQITISGKYPFTLSS